MENKFVSDIGDWDDIECPNDPDDFSINTKLPLNLKEDIMQDIYDVNQISRYCANCDFKNDIIHLLLGVYLKNIIELSEKRIAWGIDFNNILIIDVKLGSSYNIEKCNASVYVGNELDSKFRKKFVLSDVISKRIATKKVTNCNILVGILNQVVRFLLDANSKCIICDKGLHYEGYKPNICEDEKCNFVYEEIGLGFDLNQEIIDRPELLDLLISFCYSAVINNTIEHYPPNTVRGYRNKENSFLMNNKSLDVAKLLEVIKKCPSIIEMRTWVNEGLLIYNLNEIDDLLYPLLKWLITSNRSYIRLLKPEERLSDIDAPYQFAFISFYPKREAVFDQLLKTAQEERGVDNAIITAWHGSPLKNWHSIIRNGLKVFSGTKHMLHGSAFGRGIYLAPNKSTSLGYISNNKCGWAKSIYGNSPTCIARCQLINHKSVKEPKPFYVIQHEELIKTRYLFINPKV